MSIVPVGTPVDGGNSGGGATQLAFNISAVGGVNEAVLVAFAFTGADDVVSVSVATGGTGVLLHKKLSQNSGFNHYLYAVPNVSAGTRQVQINTTGGHLILGGAAEYTGLPTLTPDATNTDTSTSNVNFATTVTPVASNCWAFTNVGGSGQNPTAGAGSTIRIQDASFGTWMIADSNGTVAAGSPYSLGFTAGAAGGWDACTVSLAPSGGAPPAFGLECFQPLGQPTSHYRPTILM